jgi:hypothetical protein
MSEVVADDDDGFEITPAVVQALCARRSTMPDDAFADALCEVLEIEREMARQGDRDSGRWYARGRGGGVDRLR